MTVLRPFLCAVYLPDAQNRLTPGSTKCCPVCEIMAGACRIVGNGWRHRKCGPFLRVKLFRCQTHLLGFTVYPLGMTPYSRRSFLNFPNCFAAIADAASGCKWPDLTPLEGATFKTQKRHIARWALLFGIEPVLSENAQVQAAMTLRISHVYLREGAAKIREGPTYEGRARIVLDVLNHLDGSISLAAILQRGTTLKVWGIPIFDERDQVPLLHFTTDHHPPTLSPA